MNGAAAPKRSRVAGVEGGASGPPPTEIARDFRSRMLGEPFIETRKEWPGSNTVR
jgi:hypothetical protein